MNKYKQSFLVTCVIVSIPIIIFISAGIYKSDFYQIAFWAVPLMVWWGSYLTLKIGLKFSYIVSMIPVLVCWLPLSWQTIRRVSFIIENEGMERLDGYGSPMAFFIGILIEQFFYVPITITLVFGLLALKRINQLKAVT